MTREQLSGWAGYLVSAALLGPFIAPIVGIGDEVVTAGSLRWRFGLLGIVFNSAGYLLLAVLIAGLVAAARRQRGVVLLLGLLTGVIALLFLGGLGLFALDALQLRQMVPESIRGTVTVRSVQSLGIGGLAFLVLITVALSFLRAGRALAPRNRPGAPAIIR